MKEKRSPTSHRTKSQTKAHGRGWQSSQKQKDYRAGLGKLNYHDPKSTKGDKLDKSHIKPASKGGKPTKANTKLKPQSKNRAHGTSPGGHKRKR